MTDEFFTPIPSEWSGMEAALFVDMALTNQNMYYDGNLKTLYHAALYDFEQFSPGQRKAAIDGLKDHLRAQYHVDLDDVFDWVAYRDDISDEL